MDVAGTLEVARAAAARHDHPAAVAAYQAVAALDQLDADDLLQLSDSLWWVGDATACLEAGREAHRRLDAEDRPEAAAMAAMGVAVTHFLRGEGAAGSGWMARAVRHLEGRPESAVQGYAMYSTRVEAGFGATDLVDVVEAAREVQALGRRVRDPNLVAIAMQAEGRALVKAGRVSPGMALIDEAMAAVEGDELSPDWAGNICCNAIAACHEVGDVERMDAWATATERWLERLPAAVLFAGICRVHRVQLLVLRGEWARAEAEAARVVAELAELSTANVAEAHCSLGDVHRLRGELAAAETAYAEAHRLGRDPQPGRALLRLAQGRADDAAAAIRTALVAAADDRLARVSLCAAQVDIALAVDDLASARKAADELAEAAAAYGTSALTARAVTASGSVLLAEGHVEEALPALREACRRWQALRAPHHAAAACERLAEAYERLGDADSAAAERTAAVDCYRRLGAAAHLHRLEPPAAAHPGGLSDREVEVLALAAAGRTNREIADVLVISHKTVARHLSNTFTKLGVTTRTEAAAFAFAAGLAVPPATR